MINGKKLVKISRNLFRDKNYKRYNRCKCGKLKLKKSKICKECNSKIMKKKISVIYNKKWKKYQQKIFEGGSLKLFEMLKNKGPLFSFELKKFFGYSYGAHYETLRKRGYPILRTKISKRGGGSKCYLGLRKEIRIYYLENQRELAFKRIQELFERRAGINKLSGIKASLGHAILDGLYKPPIK